MHAKMNLLRALFTRYTICNKNQQAVIINIFVLENLFGGRSRRRRSGESFKLE